MSIVFILGTKFNARDYHRFGVDVFRRRGFDVVLWDFTGLFRPKYAANYTPVDLVEDEDLLIVNSLGEAKTCLGNIFPGSIIIDNHQVLSYLRITHHIGQGCCYGAFLLGCIPSSRETIYERGARLLKSPFKSASAVFKKFVDWQSQSRALDFLIVGGSVAEGDRRYPVNEKTLYLRAHSFDYDRYLECESEGALELGHEGQYAVFLDEDMAYHPDYMHMGVDPYVKADQYFDEINDFFDEYEKIEGVEVVIAAHPRSKYHRYGNLFRHRKVIRGGTVELVKYAKFVLAHASTSLSYAVLYDKPIALLSSHSFAPVLRRNILAFSHELGVQVIDLLRLETSLPIDYVVPYDKYRQYESKFIKSVGTNDINVWDLFCDNISMISPCC